MVLMVLVSGDNLRLLFYYLRCASIVDRSQVSGEMKRIMVGAWWWMVVGGGWELVRGKWEDGDNGC